MKWKKKSITVSAREIVANATRHRVSITPFTLPTNLTRGAYADIFRAITEPYGNETVVYTFLWLTKLNFSIPKVSFTPVCLIKAFDWRTWFFGLTRQNAFSGRFRRSDGNSKTGQTMVAGRYHIVGYRMRRTKSTGRVHENIEVQRLDQSNTAILTDRKQQTPIQKTIPSKFSRL